MRAAAHHVRAVLQKPEWRRGDSPAVARVTAMLAKCETDGLLEALTAP